MTGHRRPTGKPIKNIAAAARRYAYYTQRLTKATTPTHVVLIAAAWVASALTRTDPVTAERTAGELRDHLVNAATRLDDTTRGVRR